MAAEVGRPAVVGWGLGGWIWPEDYREAVLAESGRFADQVWTKLEGCDEVEVNEQVRRGVLTDPGTSVKPSA
jgi:hypothetical protein